LAHDSDAHPHGAFISVAFRRFDRTASVHYNKYRCSHRLPSISGDRRCAILQSPHKDGKGGYAFLMDPEFCPTCVEDIKLEEGRTKKGRYGFEKKD
jgi:hypothetical protein